MTAAGPVRESSEVLLERATNALRLAESETMPNRARIHMKAAETWRRLAARKARTEQIRSRQETP
jgi:hypothetical protein